MDDAIIFAAGNNDLPAGMGRASGGLEQHHAVIGGGHIHPARGQLVGKGAHIINRIVPAERKLEAVLAVFRAVAGAGIATGLGEHGRHITDVIHLMRGAEAADFHGRCGALAAERNGEGAGTVFKRGGNAVGGDGGGAAQFQLCLAGDIHRVAGGQLGAHEHLRVGDGAIECQLSRLDGQRCHGCALGQRFLGGHRGLGLGLLHGAHGHAFALKFHRHKCRSCLAVRRVE